MYACVFASSADAQRTVKTVFDVITQNENGNPTNGIVRLVRNIAMDETTSAAKLVKIAEDLAAYVDRKTDGATQTKVLVAPPVGLDDSISVIEQSRILPDNTPNRLLVRSFVLPMGEIEKMARGGTVTSDFVVGVDTKNDSDWDIISRNLEENANMIRAGICKALTEPDFQVARSKVDNLLDAFCLGRPRVCFTPHGVLPYLLRIERQMTPDEMIQYMVRPIG